MDLGALILPAFGLAVLSWIGFCGFMAARAGASSPHRSDERPGAPVADAAAGPVLPIADFDLRMSPTLFDDDRSAALGIGSFAGGHAVAPAMMFDSHAHGHAAELDRGAPRFGPMDADNPGMNIYGQPFSA